MVAVKQKIKPISLGEPLVNRATAAKYVALQSRDYPNNEYKVVKKGDYYYAAYMGKKGDAIRNAGVADEHAARELYLFATNDSDLYRQQITPINKNLITKKARGVYKTELAVKLAMYLMENAAKKYAREFGGTWNEMFNVPTRKEAAKEFVEHFENEAGYGNYDDLLPAKYQKKNPSLDNFRSKYLKGTLTVSDILKVEPKLTRAQAEKQLNLLYSMRPKQTDFIGQSEDEPKGRYRGTKKNATAAEKVYRIERYDANVGMWMLAGYADSKQEAQQFILRHKTDTYRVVLNGRVVKMPTKIIYTKPNATAADFRQHQKSRLQDLAAMFQGTANGEKRRVLESDYAPKDKYRLGYLVQIKIKDGGKTIPIDFDGESYLAGDLRNNLWVVGKDAKITNIKLPPKGQLKYLGELIQVDYVTAKKHIEGGKTVRFYHKLGEVTKETPNLFIDDEGFPIIVSGGYDVWDVGIVN